MRLNSRASYKLYKEKSKDPLDIKEYLDIVHGLNKFIIKKVLEGHTVKLPEGLGELSIIGKEVKPKIDKDGNITGLAPDWKETIKLWNENPEAKELKTKVYHFNEHSNNIRYKYIWSKKRVLISNKTVYSLRLTRENKRMLSSLVKEGKEYFIKD